MQQRLKQLMRLIYFNKLSLVLLLVHLVIVFVVYRQHFEGSWGGFFLFLIDFPVSLLSFLPIGWNQWFFFGVIGSIWWYLIGILILYFVKK